VANKYRAIKTVKDGITFDSKREAARYEDLKLLERAGEITDLTLQPKFPIMINGKEVFEYRADFQYEKDGERIIEDVKSAMTRKLPVYRIKKKCVEAYYGVEIQEV